MKVHELKSDPDLFGDVASGRKCFEVRENDRDYEAGDYLYLRETVFTGNMMKHCQAGLRYTGKNALVKVVYIMHGPKHGLLEGWCIMGIKMAE